MTAEVAILNRIGVALAADSAVTIGGGEDEKTYSSADKLFQLSYSNPVGVMIYGNANFVGVPWETIIKEYRRESGEEKFDTVKQHAENFFKFLEASRQLFPESEQQQHVRNMLAFCYNEVSDTIKKKITDEFEKREDVLDLADFDGIASWMLDNYLRSIHAQEKISDVCVSAIRREFEHVRPTVEKLIQNFPMRMSPPVREKFQSIGIDALCRGCFPHATNSGIVFAGFGEQEVMPVIHAYEMKGMIESNLIFSADFEHKVATDGVQIFPFAQSEIPRLFVQGIHPGLLDYMRGSTKTFFSATVTAIMDIIGENAPGIREEVTLKSQEYVDELFHEWEREKKHYSGIITQMVASFPKDELASVAETLVDLTKFRERLTPGFETVGGPIDVAVITKGDGFVWIKRKQYFDPSLNPRVVA